MITTPEDYQKQLYQLQNNNLPTIAILLPTDETIYHIDLDTRTINVPEFLSVEKDHFAETVYFTVDRFFDNMDLTTTTCIIQYENKNAKNADGEPAGGFAYLVPFYDVKHFEEQNLILIPWCIGGPATAAAGDIVFSFCFYKLNADGSDFIYKLSTQPAMSKILHGMNVITQENENFIIPETTVEKIYEQINEIRSRAPLVWVDAFEETEESKDEEAEEPGDENTEEEGDK